jgi:hypothetical protein
MLSAVDWMSTEKPRLRLFMAFHLVAWLASRTSGTISDSQWPQHQLGYVIVLLKLGT